VNAAAPALPRAAAPFVAFGRLLRRFGFAVAGEQVVAFLQSVTLLGPRSMEDIWQAALATLAPPPDRRGEFEALFRTHFHGDTGTVIEGDDDETHVKDDSGQRDEQGLADIRRQESGEASSAREQLGRRDFDGERATLAALRRDLPAALPRRRSLRQVSTHARGSLDLRRALRAIVRADGDVPDPPLRRRPFVPRRLLILIDISGSMKLHTDDHLRVAHAAVQAGTQVEVFTLGTRLTRITRALRIADQDQALARAASLVDDWDGGTRIGPTLLAFLAVPRFSAFARGAAVLLLSDGLERGDPSEMETAMRRLSARATRLSLCTPLAADPRFRPRTAALQAVLPWLDDLVDGSSIAAIGDFMLSLARPAPSAEALWKRTS